MSQLTNYIQKELDKGFTKKQITEKLLQTGYNQQEITESFQSIESKQPLLTRKLPDVLHLDPHVKWSKIVFPLLAIAILAFFVFLIWQYSAVFVPAVSPCEDVVGQEEKDRCILELAALGKGDCTGIVSSLFIAACEQKLWESDECTYTLLLGGDVESCLFQKAIETKDTTYCTRMEEHSDCLTELALALHDATICMNDVSCITTYMIKERDPTACNQVILFSEECYDAYAQQTGDSSICDKGSFVCGYPIEGTLEDRKTFIESKLSTLSTETPEGDDMSIRDEYLYNMAKQFQDTIFCEYITVVDFKEECLNEVS